MVPDTLKSLEPLWGVWRVDRLLGEGASGKVYLLTREDEAEFVSALKWIHIPKDPGEINQLHQEGHTDRQVKEYYSQLVHSLGEEIKLMHQLAGNTHVVNYLDHIILSNQEEFGWDILIRMEYLTPLAAFSMASSLDISDETVTIHTSHKYNRMNHSLTERDIIRLGCDICQALTLLEKRSIIHRDIKPENIFVSNDGDFKLGDFGISRTLEKTSYSLSVKGTPMYMAPETMLSQKADRSSDIYSLGIVMYRMLNRSRCPFLPRDGIVSSSMREEATGRRLRGESMPPPANGSKELHRIVLKACAYHPQSRYRCAQEMGDDLKALLHENRGIKPPVKKRPWLGYALAFLLFAAALIFASANGWQWNSMVSAFSGDPAHTGGVSSELSPALSDTPILKPSNTPEAAAVEAKTTAAKTVSASTAKSTTKPTPKPTTAPTKKPTPTFTPVHTPVDTPIPLGSDINRWGMTNAERLNFRSLPSITSKAIGDLLPIDLPVWVYESLHNGNDEAWLRARVNGTDGYLKAEFVDIMTQADSDAYQSSLLTTTPTRTPDDVVTPTIAPTPTPTPTPKLTPTPVVTLKPTPVITETINQGDSLKVVNCSSNASLRTKPDGNYTSGRKIVDLNETVIFIRTAENGFYLVEYKGKTGYMLAAYLTPAGSKTFKEFVSTSDFDRMFNQNDLKVNGITVNDSHLQDVRNQYGDPVFTEQSFQLLTWYYQDFDVVYNKFTSKVVRIDIYNLNAYGPRQICIGMNMAEALNTFPMNKSRILSNSITHDLILYSNRDEVLDPPYAVIQNNGDGGNGIMQFFDPVTKARMEITIQYSTVKRISVYVE